MLFSPVARPFVVGSQEGGGRAKPHQWISIMCQQWIRWCSICSSFTHPRLGRKANAMAARLTNQQAVVLLLDLET